MAAMNRIAMSGTDRVTSIKTVARMDIIGKSDCRHAANKIPMGMALANVEMAITKVSENPPQSFVSTMVRLKNPP